MSSCPDDEEVPGFHSWWVDAWITECERCGDQQVFTDGEATKAWVASHVCEG